MSFDKQNPVGSYLLDVPEDERSPERYQKYLKENNALDLIDPTAKTVRKRPAPKPSPKKADAKPDAEAN